MAYKNASLAEVLVISPVLQGSIALHLVQDTHFALLRSASAVEECNTRNDA
jgi:hypothetical protein